MPACPVQIRAHHHIAVYIDSNKQLNHSYAWPFAAELLKIHLMWIK